MRTISIIFMVCLLAGVTLCQQKQTGQSSTLEKLISLQETQQQMLKNLHLKSKELTNLTLKKDALIERQSILFQLLQDTQIKLKKIVEEKEGITQSQKPLRNYIRETEQLLRKIHLEKQVLLELRASQKLEGGRNDLEVMIKPTEKTAEKLKNKKMVHGYQVLERQLKRMEIDRKDIPLDQLGFSVIREDDYDNLYNKVQNDEIKIEKILAKDENSIVLEVYSEKEQTFTLKAGTLFYPEDDMGSSVQSLILNKDVSMKVFIQKKEVTLTTNCFNKGFGDPSQKMFRLSNIKSTLFREGMSKEQVWNITDQNRKIANQWISLQVQVLDDN